MSRSKRAAPKVGAKALCGSAPARQTASVVLESLCGVCSVEDASARLGVAVPRYYVLETRALQGLIEALEPRARGRQQSDESKLAALTRQTKRLEREVRRYQALHRAATRAIGLAPPTAKAAEARTGKERRVRRRARAERVVGVLRETDAASPSTANAPLPDLERAS